MNTSSAVIELLYASRLIDLKLLGEFIKLLLQKPLKCHDFLLPDFILIDYFELVLNSMSYKPWACHSVIK
jgi:hypothetical protein